jgi:hypothetical protein
MNNNNNEKPFEPKQVTQVRVDESLGQGLNTWIDFHTTLSRNSFLGILDSLKSLFTTTSRVKFDILV